MMVATLYSHLQIENITITSLTSDSNGSSDDEAPAAVAPVSEIAAKKKAVALAEVPDIPVDAAGGAKMEVLKAIDIKKMNGDSLKEALQVRGLSIQGAKKDLMQRLIDHEKARS